MCGRHVLVDVLWRSTRLLGNAQLFNRAILPQDNHGALRTFSALTPDRWTTGTFQIRFAVFTLGISGLKEMDGRATWHHRRKIKKRREIVSRRITKIDLV
jgi:hypothetical protein